MSSFFLFAFLVASEKPVIRLDEMTIEGHIRRPALVELEGSKLQDHIDEVALSSLMRLESELLKPGATPKNQHH
ncbi:MAG: hypothetical protein JWQ35_2582 [Bacteriovoracaceae bacterium]|nr:hypothetical protein [Bacteriovoracaceae bacterium]